MRKDFLRMRRGAAVILLSLLANVSSALADEALEQGKALATERSKGNCLACHRIADGVLPGNLGPPLVVMKARFPERERLRLQIYDASLANPHSRMPPFGRHEILTAEEIELIMDYLYTL
jgi:sulfur-oxidizing protein SoxX